MWPFTKKQEEPKGKIRGMFDPDGHFEVLVSLKNGEEVKKWLKFWSPSMRSWKQSVRDYSEKGVWVKSRYYPENQIEFISITGNSETIEYDG